MATVKELYDYIKLQVKLGKPITPFHQAIVEAYLMIIRLSIKNHDQE